MAAGDDLKLLGAWASSFVTRVKLALNFKGLSFEDIEEDFSNKIELLLSSNPVHKKVPVLLHNGKPICENLVIVQYIDEVFTGTSPSFLSHDPQERAVARFWSAYIDDKMLTALETLEGALRECSKGEGYFGGKSVGLVDIMLGSLLSWLHATEVISGTKIFDTDKTPLLAAWVKRFKELDGSKAALPDNDRMVEFAKKRQAQATAAALEN